MDKATRELMERGVRALEALAEDPEMKIETFPPVCPHCQTMNPTIRVEESEAEGALAEFVIRAQCQNCNKVFYAIPLQWGMCRTMNEAAEMVEERKRIGVFDS